MGVGMGMGVGVGMAHPSLLREGLHGDRHGGRDAAAGAGPGLAVARLALLGVVVVVRGGCCLLRLFLFPLFHFGREVEGSFHLCRKGKRKGKAEGQRVARAPQARAQGGWGGGGRRAGRGAPDRQGVNVAQVSTRQAHAPLHS